MYCTRPRKHPAFIYIVYKQSQPTYLPTPCDGSKPRSTESIKSFQDCSTCFEDEY